MVRTEVRIACPAWATDRPEPAELAVSVIAEAARTLGEDGLDAREVCVVLGDGELSRRLNDEWRGRDAATNVLAFPTMAPWEWRDTPREAEESLGDIVLAREVVLAEAAAQGKSVPWHLAHLVLHGFLHLLGYDHEDLRAAEEMEALERRILAGLGIPDPYVAETVGCVDNGMSQGDERRFLSK